jgi:hypothetical protein
MRSSADVAVSARAFRQVPAAAERIAAAYGTVTSTFRTVAHNREVGGVPNSYHLLGRALDVVRRQGITHARIASALRAAGYPLIESLDEGDHSHFAFGPAAVRRTSAAPSEAPKPKGLRLAADDHGSLLLDLGPGLHAGAASAPSLRVHIRAKR